VTIPLEPVHEQARLRRSPDVRYTEILGAPVLCNTDDRSVHAFSAATVVLWAGFDGRPLAEVAGVGRESPEWRGLVEVVRRFKATGLIEDVPAGEVEALPDLDAAVPVVTSLRVWGAWDGDSALARDQPGVFELHTPGDGATAAEVAPGSSRPGAEVPPCTVDGRAVAGVTLPPSLRVSAGAGPEVVAFAAWVRAVTDADELRRPGVVDALAGLAESVPVVPA
jgi:hypothetical protein